MAEGLAPDDDAAVAGRIDIGGERHDKVVEGLHRSHLHHLAFQAGKVRLCLHKFRRQVEPVIGPRRQLAHQADGVRPYAHLAFAPVQPVAVFQIPAKGAAEARLLLTGRHLFTARCGRRYQDRQGIDAGGTAIALLFYLIWLVSVFGNLPRSEFGPVVAQGGNVDVLLKALASVIESEAVASALNLFSMAAILSSFIGVGLGGGRLSGGSFFDSLVGTRVGEWAIPRYPDTPIPQSGVSRLSDYA